MHMLTIVAVVGVMDWMLCETIDIVFPPHRPYINIAWAIFAAASMGFWLLDMGV